MTSNIDLVLKELFALQRLGIKEGLEHTEELLDNIGNPHSNLKFIHVAGTNGKGSTCAILNKILIEHRMVVGLYTSPHLVRFNERIQVNNEKISDADIVLFMNKYIQQIKNIKTGAINIFIYHTEKKLEALVVFFLTMKLKIGLKILNLLENSV